MSIFDHRNHETDEPGPDGPQEGTYDDQLSFPAPFAASPLPFTTIIKRDGREVPFDKQKIADAIHRAAHSVGQADRSRAESLASGVAIYLAKRIGSHTPTVEQVNEAVERVLVELGHSDTALAYARYRDKRARLRELDTASTHAFLHGPLTADEDATTQGNAPSPSLFVRTSDDHLATWDSGRIVDALVRETGLDRTCAQAIASEVEAQVVSARVTTLTASLIRELVDAKLIEHGLEKCRRRHMRLGVPLYDAEQIICFPNRNEAGSMHDPQVTDLELAERVKKEFALTQVFAQEEADAHLHGDIHLHDLGWVDRLHGCAASLDYLVRFGMPMGREAPSPARHADALLYQTGRFSAALRAHFAGAVSWRAVNVSLAPFVADMGTDALHRYIRLLLVGFTHRTHARPARAAGATLEIVWRPDDAGDQPRQNGSFLDGAQRTALAFLDVAKADALDNVGTAGPLLCVRLSEEMLRDPGHQEFLLRTAELIRTGRPVRVAFDRNPRPRSRCGLDAVSVGSVSLNLPRAAYRAITRNTPNHDTAFYDELGRLVEIAVRAHLAKQRFVERLLAVKSFGPLGFLSTEIRGERLLDMRRAGHHLALTGLNECVRTLTGEQLHQSDEALACGLRIVDNVVDTCERLGRRTGLNLRASAPRPSPGSTRFAALDLRAFPEHARGVLRSDPITQDLFYTHGICLADATELTPLERVRVEGEFQSRPLSDCVCRVSAGDADVSTESLADFLRKACLQTTATCLAFEA